MTTESNPIPPLPQYVPEHHMRRAKAFIVEANLPEAYAHQQFNPVSWVKDELPKTATWQVYGIHGLPAQVSAALFSRFSRTHLSASTLLYTEFWDEIAHLPAPKTPSSDGYSSAFFDRVLGDYGDESVAEMGTLDIVLEGIPIWLAMLVQNARFGFSCIEKSTRYVPVIASSGLIHPTRFDETNAALIKKQRDLCVQLVDALKDTLQKPDTVSAAAWKRTLQAHALDCTRGLLPLGTATNVAVHANARAWTDIICDLLAYGEIMGDPNATALAEMIKQVCLTMAPALFRDFVDGKGKERIAKRIEALQAEMDYSITDGDNPSTVTAGAYVQTREPIRAFIDPIASRPTRHTKIPRDFAHNTTATMGAWCSLAAYRDMRRGRRLFWGQPKTTREALWNYTEHPMLISLGGRVAQLGQAYIAFLHDVASVRVDEDTPDWEQWYSLPLATPCWFTVTGDLPAWSWLCELRSTQQGHYEYRALAQAMAQAYLEGAPTAIALAFEHVNYDESGLARLAAEHKKDR